MRYKVALTVIGTIFLVLFFEIFALFLSARFWDYLNFLSRNPLVISTVICFPIAGISAVFLWRRNKIVSVTALMASLLLLILMVILDMGRGRDDIKKTRPALEKGVNQSMRS